MSYNGSGTFNINTTGQPVVAGTVISSSAFNALTTDLATGLTTAITKDGQTTTTARITFAQGFTSSLVTDSSSVSTGSIITGGGVGIAKALYVGTTANVAGAVTLGGIATFSAQPIFSSLTASSAVATDASKGLVSVTNTGTGNNVLATSPTLVTPVLGAASATSITVAAGAVGTPSITTTGDTNTGIFFPAADTIAFSEGGTEAMRIDSSGNVGIGTTAPETKLQITASNSGGMGASILLDNPSSSALGSGNQIAFTNDSGASFAGVCNVRLKSLTTTAITGAAAFTITTYDGSAEGERVRIDSSGNLLVGTTSAPAISGVPSNSFYLNSGAGGNWALGIQNTASSGGARGIAINYSAQTPNDTQSEPLFFSDSTAYRFRFVSNGGLYNYSANNSNISDRREKTNFAPSKPYLNVICSIPVQTFNYIDQNIEQDDGLTLGVVAQDVQAVAPEFVTEANWGTIDEPKMRLSIYQTDLQYALMKSIQELKAINDTQAETINALTARVVALESK